MLLLACGADESPFSPVTHDPLGPQQLGQPCDCAERGEELLDAEMRPRVQCGPPCDGPWCGALHSCHWQLPQ